MSRPIGPDRGLTLFARLLEFGVGEPLQFAKNYMGFSVEHLGQLDQAQGNAAVIEAQRKVKQWHAERFEAERKRVEGLLAPPVEGETTPDEWVEA